MSPSNSGIDIVIGGASIFRTLPAPDAPALLSLLKHHQILHIDSAVVYGDSEEVLGLNRAGDSFTIDTKIPGGLRPGTATREGVVETGRASLRRLGMKSVNTLYVHSPDTTIPFEETLAGLDQLFREGVFRRLGLSNFTPDQVREMIRICETNGYVKPSVYQGNYNAFARSYEDTLLPLLREHGISFYAYSPQAGGFLSKSDELVNSSTGPGRFHDDTPIGKMYQALYKKPTLLKGLRVWNEIAAEAGLAPSDMATRWVRFDSALGREHGDALIIGGRTVEQVEGTLKALEQGPLGEEVVKRIQGVWEVVRDEAPVDNYHDFVVGAQKG